MPFLDKEKRKEYMKEYRKSYRKTAVYKQHKKKYFQNNRKWDFIGVDGEGENYGEKFKVVIKNGKRESVYWFQKHRYTLLALSTGAKIYEPEGLKTRQILKFFCDARDENPKGIFVIFAGGYDCNHILMSDLSQAEVKTLHQGDRLQLTYENELYELEYRARKRLLIRRGRIFYKDKNNKWKIKWKTRFVMWDVWGFFQDSFVGVVTKWLGKDYRHYELIKEMKALRGHFHDVDKNKIELYNAAELEALVEVMNKVRAALLGLGFDTGRWDGAGAVASAIFRKHDVKRHKYTQELLPEIQNAVQCAYAGGRIEICKIGTYKGITYDYDINSAYPSIMYDLPSLFGGVWEKGNDSNPPNGFTLVHIKFNFVSELPFYPCFYRTTMKSILFPKEGEGWYWYPEYEAAMNTPGIIEVLEWYHFKPLTHEKPFAFIKEYYETRQQWLKNPTEEWHKGGEKIIKLGLNSLYGKTAQQLGGTLLNKPPYHQLEWAGYITSAVRAKLYIAAMNDCDAIIGFATDGIFSQKPLPLDISETKEFGKWELKKDNNGNLPIGVTVVMAGFYWWHNSDGTYENFSRGFDKDFTKTPAFLEAAWKKKEMFTEAQIRRLIGVGTALASENFWNMRGCFVETHRKLRTSGYSVKRDGVSLSNNKLYNTMVSTTPTENEEYNMGFQQCSAPHPIIWYLDENDAEKDEFGENSLDVAMEILDNTNI